MSKVETTRKDAIAKEQHCSGGLYAKQNHFLYQAWSYAVTYRRTTTKTVRQDPSPRLRPWPIYTNLDSAESHQLISCYQEHTAKAPVFIRPTSRSSITFLKQFVKLATQRGIMYRIEHGQN